MTPLLKKMNYKTGPMVVLNVPAELVDEISEWKKAGDVATKQSKQPVSFGVAFCITAKQLEQSTEALMQYTSDDAIIWLCYPKKSSKKYKCEFDRDSGWETAGKMGWEPVRMVAVNDDWSALRFRKPEHIKKMTRSFAITEAGRQKSAANRKA